MMPEFDRQWEDLGLDDDDLRELQDILLKNTKAGKVIKGTKGLRKVRIAFEGQGKRGSGRVAYVDFTVYESIYLITAYPKSVKDDLSSKEKKEIAKKIGVLEQGFKKQEKKK